MIAYLASSTLAPTLRRRMFKQWCSEQGVSFTRRELDDVAPPRRVERNLCLDFTRDEQL